MEKRYENYHKHTWWSNVRITDCVVSIEEYMQRAVSLGHKIYFTTEHGWQGNIPLSFTLCQKYGLKCVYGVEAYYVDDIQDKSERTAYHLMLVALNKSGQLQLNKILSIANKDGFYYKPRIDLNLLISLNPNDVIVTSACIQSRLFKYGWKEKFFIPVWDHFKDHFLLEVQNHNVEAQKEHNRKILELKKEYPIQLIHGNDSHYIFQEDSKYRDIYLKNKGINYSEEDSFIMDYPTYDEIVERYKTQGVLSEREIQEALDNTLIFDNAECVCLDKQFKMPDINYSFLSEMMGKKYTSSDSDSKILRDIIRKEWNREKKNIQQNKIKEYETAIYYEMDIVKKCKMEKYFVIDYMIVKHAVNDYGAVITRSGRGSAVSFYINHLLGLTEVDRLKSPITLYPTRFMSAERILKTCSLPDIDQNYADVTPVIQASKDILGEDGIYYMVSYKPLQKASAFRAWCKGIGLNIKEYDDIAKNIESYTDDPMWGNVIKDSERFVGVIDSIAPSPCSFLLLSNPISEEVGLLKVGNEICCCLDGYYCDVYKYLKNDFLTVSVYSIIDKVYKEINQPIDSIESLLSKCDESVWDIYKNALTTTINQCDSDFAKSTLKRYQPKSLSELSAWVAAIRPGFASLLNNFLDRKPYSTGVEELDDILKDSFHYLMYQESIMKYLVWLGIEEKETYDIIKKISKKKFKEEELNELREKLKAGWIKKIHKEDGFNETWTVVQDAARYSFNASHSLCVAIDSLYGAYLKSHYPLEYFLTVLSFYSEDTEKTAKLIDELPYFGIKLKPIQFGKSKTDYSYDKNTNEIYKGIYSVKYCNAKIADELLGVSRKNPKDFIELLSMLKETSVTSKQIEILIKLNFFSTFGKNQYLLSVFDVYNEFNNRSIIQKKKLKNYNEKYGIIEDDVKKFSKKESPTQYRNVDNVGLMNFIICNFSNDNLTAKEQIEADYEYLEYTDYKNNEINNFIYIVVEFKTYKDTSKPYLKLRNLNSGNEIKCRIKNGELYNGRKFKRFSILKINGFCFDFKKTLKDGKWITSNERECILDSYELIER